jgi:phenylpropionate dioxygenase-like ring-hydroxylating dioxygenase large terminal subunit
MHLPQKGFDMELGTKLFQKYWHMVCHRNELPDDGDFLRFKTPIGDVVVFNDGGDYVAFNNRCAHRGALIYLADFGNQANTCMAFPQISRQI